MIIVIAFFYYVVYLLNRFRSGRCAWGIGADDINAIFVTAIVLLELFSGVIYRDVVSDAVWVMFFGANALIQLGAFFGSYVYSFERIGPPAQVNIRHVAGAGIKFIRSVNYGMLGRLVLYVILILMIFGGIALTVQRLPILFANGFTGMRKMLQAGDIQAGPLATIGRLIVLYVYAIPLVVLQRRSLPRTLLIVAVVLVVGACLLEVILDAGRWPLFWAAAALFCCLDVPLRFLWRKMHYLVGVFILLNLAASALIYFRQEGQTGLENYAIAYNIEYTQELTDVMRSAPQFVQTAYVTTVTYITQGVHYLQSYYGTTDPNNKGVLHGIFLHKILGTSDWDQYALERYFVGESLVMEQRFENVWGTGVRELLQDFGVYGALIASFLLGFSYKASWVSLRQGFGLPYAFVGPFLTLMVIFFPLTNPVLSIIFTFGLNLGVILFFAVWCFRSVFK